MGDRSFGLVQREKGGRKFTAGKKAGAKDGLWKDLLVFEQSRVDLGSSRLEHGVLQAETVAMPFCNKQVYLTQEKLQVLESLCIVCVCMFKYVSTPRWLFFLSFNFFLIMAAIPKTCFCLSQTKYTVSTYGAYFVLVQFILRNQLS